MLADPSTITIDPSVLIAKLQELDTASDGNLSRIIELLLLENHVLIQHQSVGFRRGAKYEFSDFPRFLQLDEAVGTESDENK